MQSVEREKHESLNYTLSKLNVIFISVYYIILVLSGIVISVFVMANIKTFVLNNILLYTSIASISVTCMLCGMQYLKRIYRACIDGRIESGLECTWQKRAGNLLYFILRPIYASAFVVIAQFALLGGIIIVTSVDVVINERFLYLCVTMSTFIGFSVGRVLDGFEKYSAKRIDDVLMGKDKDI